MEEKYQPVSCDYHDQLEAAATKRVNVELTFDERGVHQRERGKIEDVFSRDGAEFVRLRGDSGNDVEIRLDHIANVREL